MAKLPPLELLEATHQFPGPYTFKAIGVAEGEFERRVVQAVQEAVREVLGTAQNPRHFSRSTSGGKHIAVTLEINVLNAAQVHAIYDRLLTVEGLLVLL